MQINWSKLNLTGASLYSTPILLLILLSYTFLWLLHPKPLVISDPWAYSRIAFRIAETGDLNTLQNHVFSHRLAVTLPIAVLYSTFGVNAITTHLFSLVAALIIIVAVWYVMPYNLSRLTATLLVTFSAPVFMLSTQIYPDLLATSFMLLAASALYYRERVCEHRYTWLWLPLCAVLFLFLSFLSKLSAYWILPIYLFYFIFDLYRRRFDLLRTYYLPAFGWAIIFGFGYLFISNTIWGDYLARFSAVEGLTGQHLWAWSDTSLSELIQRLTIAPAIMLVRNFDVLPILFFWGLFVAPKASRFWVFYTFCLLGFYWFGSTSFSAYEPMPVNARMVLPTIPGMCVIAGHLVASFTVEIPRSLFIGKSLGVATVLSLAFIPWSYSVYQQIRMPVPEHEAMLLVKEQVLGNPDSEYLLLTSDERSSNALSYHFSYAYPSNLSVAFMGEDEIAKLLYEHDQAFVFMNTDRSDFLEDAYGSIHFDTTIIEQAWPILYKNEAVYLYYPVETRAVEVILQTP